MLILINLRFMHPLSQLILPARNTNLQSPYLLHQHLELYVKLNMQAIISNQLKSLLNERKQTNLLIRTKHPILVLIKNSHKLLNRTDPSKTIQLRLKLPKNHLQHLLSQVRSRHLILRQSCPNSLTFICTITITISLSLQFSHNCRVQWVERIQTLGVELYRRYGVATVWSNVRHICISYKKLFHQPRPVRAIVDNNFDSWSYWVSASSW